MTYVTFGTDTYGNVKKVGTTAVVTKFTMFSCLPVWPVESYYYTGPGESRFEGVLFIYGTTTTEIRGMPLAHVDRLSVLMTYVRAVFAVMLVVGSLSIFTLLMDLYGQAPNNSARGTTQALVVVLCAGTVGGLLTYCMPFQITQRDRDIRSRCGELFGVSADPAFVREDVAQSILSTLADHDGSEGIDPFDNAPVPVDRSSYLVQLARIRAVIALGHDRESLERRTDELLTQIENASRTAV